MVEQGFLSNSARQWSKSRLQAPLLIHNAGSFEQVSGSKLSQPQGCPYSNDSVLASGQVAFKPRHPLFSAEQGPLRASVGQLWQPRATATRFFLAFQSQKQLCLPVSVRPGSGARSSSSVILSSASFRRCVHSAEDPGCNEKLMFVIPDPVCSLHSLNIIMDLLRKKQTSMTLR